MGFNMNAEQYVKDRNAAFTAFVLNDDWGPVKEYCTNYCIAMPDNPDVTAAGIYKAVQECTDIPDDVKVKAAMKCMKLGFVPFISPAVQAKPKKRIKDHVCGNDYCELE